MAPEINEVKKKYALKQNFEVKNIYVYWIISPGFLLFWLFLVNLRRQLLPNLSSFCCVSRHPLDIVDPTVFNTAVILILLL